MPMITSQNTVPPFKTMVEGFDNLTRDYLIDDNNRLIWRFRDMFATTK